MKIEIGREALQKMHGHAEADYPNECCGFFFGRAGEIRRVDIARKVSNAKEGDRSNRFRIDPKEYQKAEAFADERNLDLLGVYHSHPDHPAEPSEHDRKVAMPWFSYIIISVRNGKAVETRSWQLNADRRFEEETVGKNESYTTKKKTT